MNIPDHTKLTARIWDAEQAKGEKCRACNLDCEDCGMATILTLQDLRNREYALRMGWTRKERLNES